MDCRCQPCRPIKNDAVITSVVYRKHCPFCRVGKGQFHGENCPFNICIKCDKHLLLCQCTMGVRKPFVGVMVSSL